MPGRGSDIFYFHVFPLSVKSPWGTRRMKYGVGGGKMVARLIHAQRHVKQIPWKKDQRTDQTRRDPRTCYNEPERVGPHLIRRSKSLIFMLRCRDWKSKASNVRRKKRWQVGESLNGKLFYEKVICVFKDEIAFTLSSILYLHDWL